MRSAAPIIAQDIGYEVKEEAIMLEGETARKSFPDHSNPTQ